MAGVVLEDGDEKTTEGEEGTEMVSDGEDEVGGGVVSASMAVVGAAQSVESDKKRQEGEGVVASIYGTVHMPALLGDEEGTEGTEGGNGKEEAEGKAAQEDEDEAAPPPETLRFHVRVFREKGATKYVFKRLWGDGFRMSTLVLAAGKALTLRDQTH
jgi:hypothetical protein